MLRGLRGVVMGVLSRAMVDIWKLEAMIEGRYLDKIKSVKGNYKFKIDYRKPPCLIVRELKKEIVKLNKELEKMEDNTSEHKELLNFILLLNFKEITLRERGIEELVDSV